MHMTTSPAKDNQVQDETILVRRAKEKDTQAMAELYEKYFDQIYRYIAIKLGDKTEAEDLTQQVFLRVLHSIGKYEQRGLPFSSWLYRIAHNQIVDYLRKSSKKKTSPLNEAITARGVSPVAITEQKMTLEQLAIASKDLTEAQREAFTLRLVSGLSIVETAAAMGKSKGAIKALQHSALMALRKNLIPQGSSPGEGS